MIHFSCDRCKRPIDADMELRYEVRMEIKAMMSPLEAEPGVEDRDHLLEIEEILERLEDAQDENIGEDIYQNHRYDLCADCYRKVVKNPLGRETSTHLNFSKN